LEGVSDDRAAQLAGRVAGRLERSDATTLVRIGRSLAIVSADQPAKYLTRDASDWENATLGPAGNVVGYTTAGDLYLHQIRSGRTFRLTDDGSETLLDGIFDWTYQEEIFGRGNYRAFWFSPSGDRLAMIRVDISRIEPYVLTGASTERGTSVVRRYSKAGDPIPHASLHLWDLRELEEGETPASREIVRSTPDRPRIISGVWWNPHGEALVYTVSDRLQTWRELRRVEPTVARRRAGRSRTLLRETSPAWVEPPAAPSFLENGSLIWRSALPSGRARLFRISPDGDVITPLSPAEFDVRDFFVAPDGEFALVTGDAARGTVEQHVFRIDLEEAAGRDRPLRELTAARGWNAASFRPDGGAMIVTRSSIDHPPQLSVRSTEANDAAEPTSLASTSLEVPGGWASREFVRIDVGDGIAIPAMIVRPRSASAENPCPVMVETYGGPQAPVVRNRWPGRRGLYRELLARRGVATLVVDNRSSAGRGFADTWSIRHRVGEVECRDLLAAVDWLKGREWVDGDRVGLRGWSFGGFLTLYAMTHSDAFAAGIAGGSVTDWREYDSFYTERYMGLPSENPEGYEATSPIAAASDLHGRLLMIHGELDDNVHPANTLRMAAALQSAGKPFDLMIYPGAAHGVHQPQQVWHMAQMIDGFLTEHLAGGGR